MPGRLTEPNFKHITTKELHSTFVAEIQGVDFSKPVEPGVFSEIYAALAKYGVCVFRATGLDDTRHVEFSPKFPYLELFDAGNLDENGDVIGVDSQRAHYNKGNGLWHVDSSFNPRRASYSLLLAHSIPPPGSGGSTFFADTRTAYDTLPSPLKTELDTNDYIAAHSLFHSRKLGSPTYFSDLDPLAHKMTRHKILQTHEPSGRKNLYIAKHAHHIEGVSAEKSEQILEGLIDWATRKEGVCEVLWEQEGDLVIWDNTCVMHRAGGGSFEGVYKRDMRRTTVHDASSTAWG
ncbi:alpha-ketoglutarate-dependent 2,4-dichlorophenoxyacetate dioxygenase [Rhexocercosporidium sp. MPI-PUGE-AT-0058]|nr:alpha-ketoglutarate-dependent 2,4-dichlorophenoxyacetate dioxygenase [Rhexocercosporidium sp. MPI-PUGE-AT-0058]